MGRRATSGNKAPQAATPHKSPHTQTGPNSECIDPHNPWLRRLNLEYFPALPPLTIIYFRPVFMRVSMNRLLPPFPKVYCGDSPQIPPHSPQFPPQFSRSILSFISSQNALQRAHRRRYIIPPALVDRGTAGRWRGRQGIAGARVECLAVNARPRADFDIAFQPPVCLGVLAE